MSALRTTGRVVLGFVVFLLALVGLLSIFPSTPVSRVLAVQERPPAVSDSLFPEIVGALTGTSVEPGHRVEVLHNGVETFPRLWSDLRGARRSITIQVYYARPGRVADTLSAILRERASAGVAALFLYDAFGGQDLTRGWLDSLRAGGVRVVALRPMHWYTVDRLQHRAHVRAIVIDGEIGYTGGFGFDDKWLGDGRTRGAWRDTNVRFRGPAVMRLQSAFLAAWAEATGTLLTGELFFPPRGFRLDGAVDAGLLHTTPGTGSTAAERFLALSIAGARRRLYLTNSYFVPDDDLIRLLAAAARRGVDVRILVPGDKIDVKAVRWAGRAAYEPLLEAGVRIWEYQPAMMHAKTFVIDGLWSTVGGMNFDNRSLALNDEATLVVRDPGVGAGLTARFLQDLRLAREIRLPTFRRRPWHERVMEWGASRVRMLL